MQRTSGDERHRFVVSTVTRIPLSFQFSGIAPVASPKPFAVTDGRDLNNNNVFFDDYPNGLRTEMPSSDWKNWYRTVDVRLARALFTRGVQKVTLIAEAFNVFNFDNISTFGSQQLTAAGVPIASFGTGTGVFAARQAQVGVKVEF